MSIYIFVGPDSLSLDKYYLDFRQNYQRVEFLENLDQHLLEDRVANLGFFPEKKLFVTKNVFLNRVRVGKVAIQLDHDLKMLQKLLGEHDFLFLDDDSNKLKYYLKYFAKANIKEFKIAAYLFSFLDNFTPKNLNQCYQYWQKALLKNPAELALFMLKRRIRELLTLNSGSLSGRYQSWQVSKLKNQLKAWDFKKLKQVYKSLYNYEKGLKTGTNPLNAEQVMDTILALSL